MGVFGFQTNSASQSFTLKADEVGFLRNAATQQTTIHHISTDRSLNIHGLESWIIDKATLIKKVK
jgi:hypothetical protein